MTVASPSPSRIYLLRHAEAGWPENGQKDFDRALNDKGYAQAEIVMDRAADLNYRPDLVICSTALRCRQTAEAVRRALCDEDAPFRFVDELYNGSQLVYAEILSVPSNPRSVMLIGHNPSICETLEALAGADDINTIIPNGYPPCGLAVLERIENTAVSEQAWRLIDFIQA
ncbi:phosphohistidine phosphatase [Agrobacterium vitis]|nr:phosphohistidine phosphatase [Agrobacterium vitis]MBE1437582.1 phosphohistidine phosphatase [Agrobacterium vitis]